MPRMNSVFEKFDEFDGGQPNSNPNPKPNPNSNPDVGIYKSNEAKWEPAYDFVLNQGEAVVFSPGMFHETVTLGEKGSI